MSGNGCYPHDCYPDRRKLADRRAADRREAERRRVADIERLRAILGVPADVGRFDLQLVAPRRVGNLSPDPVILDIWLRGPFPLDLRGMSRDELLRRGA